MKLKLSLLICAFALSHAYAGVDIDWFHAYKGVGEWIDRDANDNVYTATSDGSIWLHKTDKFGNFLWEVQDTTNLLFNYETPVRVHIDSAGNATVVGYRYTTSIENGNHANALIILKYSSDGVLQWKTVIAGDYSAFYQERYHNNVASVMDAASNVYVGTGGNVAGNPVGFNAIKISPTGNIVWKKVKSFVSGYHLVLNIRLHNNTLGLAGYSALFDNDALIWTLTTDGATLFKKAKTGSAGTDVAFDNDNNIYLLANVNDAISTESDGDIAVYKFSATGSMILKKAYDFGGTEFALRMEYSPDNKMVIGAYGNQFPGGSLYVDWLTLKINLNGKLIWSQRYDEQQNNDEFPVALAVRNDGAIFLTGIGGPFPGGENLGKRQWVTVKYLPNGTEDWVVPIDTFTEYITGVSIRLGSDGNLFVLADYSGSLIHLLDFTGGDPCSVPTGLIAANVTADQAVINWNAVTNAFLYHLEYKPSTSNTWITVPTDLTEATLTGLFPGTTYDFRLLAFCNSGPTAFTPAQQFVTTGSGYCASAGVNSSEEWIDLVYVSTLLNSTGNDGGYKDYTYLSVDLQQGTTYSLTLSADIPNGPHFETWTVWIDYNQDGDFTDAGEKIVKYKSEQIGWESHDFTVPNTALPGPTRMRVSMKRGTAQTPCETFAFGEVEDYTVNIVAPRLSDASTNNQSVLMAYPNPGNDQLNISFAGKNISAVKITDVQGRIIFSDENISGETLNVKTDQWPAGVYLLRLIDESGTLHSVKWIKQ